MRWPTPPQPCRALVVFVFVSLSSGACVAAPVVTGQFVRDTDVVGLDEPAMSTRLDRKDLLRVFDQQLSAFLGSPFYLAASDGRRHPTIAVVPVRNETSEHIDDQLDALVSKFERELTERQVLAVVSLENHPELISQIQAEQHPVFDRATAARYGRLLGVDYVVTGKVFDNTERTTNMRRVQYFLFLQVIGVETGRVVWDGESAVTKALVADL